jgi:hypothetical protein
MLSAALSGVAREALNMIRDTVSGVKAPPLGCETIDGTFNHDREGTQKECDTLAGQGLIFPESYLKGDLDICVLLDRPGNAGIIAPRCQSIVFSNVNEGQIFDNQIGRRRLVDISDFETIKGRRGYDGHDELVLVGNIESMKVVEKIVPARIRFQFAEFLDDLFAGDLYLSLREKTFKTLRFSAEGKHDVLGTRRIEWRNNVPREVIERRPKVMNGVPDDERIRFGNGCVYIDAQGALTGLSVVKDVHLAANFPVEIVALGIQVFDVMLGPL